MIEEKVLTPTVIEDVPFLSEGTTETVPTGEPSVNNATTSTQTTQKPAPFPRKLVAHETISQSLDTKSKKILQEFEFTQSGAIQVGKYENGVSGDIKISPSGIVARNTSGLTTFAIDGETGNATFAGELQSGSLITGQITVGNNTWIIDGDPDNPQIVLYNDGIPEIVLGVV